LKIISVKSNLLWSIVLLFLMNGCGLKANPEPRASSVMQMQSVPTLVAKTEENSVLLTWSLENADRKNHYVNIEKSDMGEKGKVCRNCPLAFEKITGVTVQKKNNLYSFADSSVEKGRIYSYRLMFCDQAGICRVSETVEIDFQ